MGFMMILNEYWKKFPRQVFGEFSEFQIKSPGCDNLC